MVILVLQQLFETLYVDKASFIMPHKKSNLPTKICTVCQRPFTWRKKWEKVWDEVKYCSDRCRSNKNKTTEKPA